MGFGFWLQIFWVLKIEGYLYLCVGGSEEEGIRNVCLKFGSVVVVGRCRDFGFRIEPF